MDHNSQYIHVKPQKKCYITVMSLTVKKLQIEKLLS
jgi:hypothetical protein